MRHRSRPWPLAAAAWTLALLGLGCAGPSGATKKGLNSLIAARDYAGAEKFLESAKLTQYGKKNLVLYYLDKGAVLHDAGKYKESDGSFDMAEKRMEELYTKSVSKAAGTMLLNDNTVDYAGEPFERAMTNVYRALNYVFLGLPEEALVESRKVETFLEELGRKLEKKPVYKDDAFARYLDALLYEDAGKYDDARISREAAEAAYAWYASAYGTPAPRFDLPPDPGKDLGEVVFIHYNGVAPRKISKTFQVAWGQAAALVQSSPDSDREDPRYKNAVAAGFLGKAVTVAFPDYIQDSYAIVSSEIDAGEGLKAESRLMEDVSAIAMKNLKDHQGAVKARAIVRATVKYVIAESASRAAADACDKQYGKNTWQSSLCRGMSRGLAHGVAAATEIADTRAWSSLPSQIRMARLKLPPGSRTITVYFKNASGTQLSSAVFKDVQVPKGKRVYLHYRTAI